MNDQIDQFGRDKSKPLNEYSSEEKSKKILDSLAEIKNQLENKNYTPQIETNKNTSNKDFKSFKKKDSDFEQLQQRIEFLEEKLITFINKQPSYDYEKKFDIGKNFKSEKSIFHSFGSNHELDKGKSLLVLKDQNQSEIIKFKFYHFVFILITSITILIILTSYKFKISFLETVNIFFSNFN